MFDKEQGDKGLALLLCGFTAGFVLCAFQGPFEWGAIAVGVATLIVALTAVSGQRLKTPLLLSLTAIAGFAMGMDTDLEQGTLVVYGGFLLGVFVALTIFEVYFLYIALLVKKPWHHVALRIFSSWIATISLMYLAFSVASILKN